jgi:hypothetical protein
MAFIIVYFKACRSDGNKYICVYEGEKKMLATPKEAERRVVKEGIIKERIF